MKLETIIAIPTFSFALMIAFLKFDYTYWISGIIILAIVVRYCIYNEMHGRSVE